jgi:hypothetical protein
MRTGSAREEHVLAHNREPRLPALAVILMLLFAAVGFASLRPSAAAAEPHAATSKKGQAPNAQRRARVRRTLTRRLRRNPGLVLNRSFMHEASLVDFQLPLTVRLGRSNGQGGYEASDDVLEIGWDDSVVPWPLAGGAPGATQTTLLSGRFTMQASFGGDASGYGQLGAMETVQGAGLSMTATPFTISDFFPTCMTGPQLAIAPAQPVAISSGGFRFGLLNLFSQTIQGTLALRMTFPAEATPACGGTPAATPVVDNTTAPAMPLRYDGTFRMSPSITADGKIRFGRITVDDAVTPQISTFAYVRSCTGTVACDAQQFPARLKLKKLTAEVLLGDLGP